MSSETIRSRIWQEEAEPDNAFAALSCHCHGYDVYGDLLVHASWIEYLFLLFRGEAPSREQARLLEGLAIALANPGPRDAAVHAAMCGGVGGSTSASCLMAALAVGAGASGGAREVFNAMEDWQTRGTDLVLWQKGLSVKPVARSGRCLASCRSSCWVRSIRCALCHPSTAITRTSCQSGMRAFSGLVANQPDFAGISRRAATGDEWCGGGSIA